MDKVGILKTISFGQRIAEEEADLLATYFVETDQWTRLSRGDIDVIYGPKGAGKSALYSLLMAKSGELFDRGILLVGAENPRGATAFQELTFDPPASEREFIGLWKLYIAALLHAALIDFDVQNESSRQLEGALVKDGLVKGQRSLGGLLQTVRLYITRAFRPKGLEGTVNLDPITQMPQGFTGKIIFSEPGELGSDRELRSVDALLLLANQAFREAGIQGWILLDRLDVAFAENADLESNALRALFRVYLDMGALSNLTLKIFLRTDIWARITSQGFREASHITRNVTLEWSRNALLNLVVRRSLHNPSLRDAYGVATDPSHLSIAEQEAFFYRMCPPQVDAGPNKSSTFDWLLSRTRDGSKLNAPRELIHLLNSLRETQVKRFEVGEAAPEDEMLFARPAFKDALPEVSKVRLEQTLYAEFPELKSWLEKLRGAKTAHTLETLADVWGVSREEAAAKAGDLVGVGFFEKRGSLQSPEFWVPFLYRDGLDMSQGSAE